ncbi:uncharacterized protein LOC121872686 isoform X2 [Homarus americanus]|uniref:uncharacterized protein LOC121872686 isoform X2 n=1 Tax=Homarus americanus TaxID=6706 RepID=UPI001C442ADD|nr:uncharacterized protein LOC121872686 isoform X2 [Homarus americanus]
MGNTTVKDAVEGSEGNRSLDLSCKLTPSQYIKHTSGEFIEGCLSALPWEVYFNVSLYENVNASFNFINEIPVELSIHVPHLRSLNVSHNQICDLPTSFNLLLHLRVLDLSYNKLKMLPAALTRLPQLHTLNVANNYLKELPTTVSKLQNLKKLNVSNNQLRALPGCLVECPKLCILVTQGNDLIHPPQAICDMGSKTTLDFLKERHPPAVQSSTVKASVFVRVRGQQVLASVSNPESASMEYRQAQGTSRTNKRKCPLMPPVNATTLKPDQLKNMLLGLLYGMAIGDAMALNTEGLTVDECIFFYDPENLSLDTRIYDYLRTHFPPHDWSSNTDIMILTLDSLMRWGGVVDELELASQLDQWRVHGYADLDPSPGYLLSPFMKKVITVEGYSANPHAAAQAIYKQTKDEISRGICTFNPSDNSCLPSALVLGVPNFYVDHEVEMNAERICKATHADPMAKATCIFLALLMATILQGKVADAATSFTNLFIELKEKVGELFSDTKEKNKFLSAFLIKDKKCLRGCDVLTSISLLISVLEKENYSFKEELSDIIMRGGDGVSVHGSIVGGVLGAVLGYSQLPQDWLLQLPQENIRLMNCKLNLLLDLFGLP